MKRLVLLIFSFLTALSVLSGCGNFANKEYSTKNFWSVGMNTEATLSITDKFSEEKTKEFNDLCADVSELIYSLNASLSVTVADSSISKFNEAEAGAEVEIDGTAYEVLTLAKNIYEMTDGYYNPAVYYSVIAYGFNTQTSYPDSVDGLPDDDVVAKYVELSNCFGETQLYTADGKYYAKKPTVTVEIGGAIYSMKIDLGGVGKGYAVDKVNELIDAYGFEYGYFSFGSSSMVCKKYYVNDLYTIGITNPRAQSGGASNYLSLSVSDICISTSGDNEQYYEFDGVRYCHIIDPFTGKPVRTGIMTASVIGGGAAEGDAFTTAIMAMGTERAVAFVNKYLSDRKVVITYDNGGKYEIITNVPSDQLNILDQRYEVVSSLSDGKIIIGN